MKTYYIALFDARGRKHGRFYPGEVLEKAKVKFRVAKNDEPGRGEFVDSYAVFERRAEARKALKACQNYLPSVDYRVMEVGESKRDASREVQGWVIIYGKNEGRGISAYNPHSNPNPRNLLFGENIELTREVLFDRYGDYYKGYLIARREDARRVIHKIMADADGKLPRRGERQYSIEAVYA